MNLRSLSPGLFYTWEATRIVADLRPADAFLKGSLPGAVSLPLENFYSLPALVQELNLLNKKDPVHLIAPDDLLAESLSSQLDLYYLKGGYTSFKVWREQVFAQSFPIIILGGKTGSGKTELLQSLNSKGFQTINLEMLAKHRGSVFGNLSQETQPAHENFQNELLKEWLKLNPERPVWMEEKNHLLGSVGIPVSLYNNMQTAPLFELEVDKEERLHHLEKEYQEADKESFIAAIRRLEERMGMSLNHKALHYYRTGQTRKCFQLLLDYYDRSYATRRERYLEGAKIPVQRSAFENMSEIMKMEAYAISLYKKRDPADFCRGLH